MYEENGRKRGSIVLLAVFLAGMLVAGGAIWAYNHEANNPAVAAGEAAVAQEPSTGGGGAAMLPGLGPNTIAEIVKKAGPAVVKIDTEVASPSGNPFFDDPFFRQFFGQDFQHPSVRVQKGLGSGFIISKDGYILTNEHVINNARKIEVTITGYDKPLPAELVGSDFDLDLAVLKVKAPRDLPVLEMGDSDQVEVGNWVIAIGNPYGLDHTVTVGVISAKGRPVDVEDRQYKNLLQTDASINPGNSGGPLLNLQGQVVGINTAVNAQAQGIGFAIPTSTVQGVLDDLLKKGKVVRPWLGVYIQPVDKEIADYFGLPGTEGALVYGVVPGGPADKAGLERGDVILEYNKHKIRTSQDLLDFINKSKIGEQVSLLIFRDKRTQVVTVTIGEKGSVQ